MAILLEHNTKVLVQGITGKEGQKASQSMREYGTTVVGGVRPGKAGELVEGVPVFDSVKDALAAVGTIDVTTIYVPPFAAKAAILEAIDAGIPLINTIIERIPIQDTAYCLAAAKDRGVRLIGPSSLGFISPGIGRAKRISRSNFSAGEHWYYFSLGWHDKRSELASTQSRLGTKYSCARRRRLTYGYYLCRSLTLI